MLTLNGTGSMEYVRSSIRVEDVKIKPKIFQNFGQNNQITATHKVGSMSWVLKVKKAKVTLS